MTERAPKGFVTIGMVSAHPKTRFIKSYFDLGFFDATHGSRHLHPFVPQLISGGSSLVANARNTTVRGFLSLDDSGDIKRPDWLLFLDDDQEYPVHTLERLIEAADPERRPIVGFPVWRFVRDEDGHPRVTHNLFTVDEHGYFAERTEDVPPNTLLQVPALGAGCLLIHRVALERVADEAAKRGYAMGHGWFATPTLPSGAPEGEDLHFCRMAGLAGLPVFALTTHTLGHIKEIVLDRPMPVGAVTA